MIYIMMGLVFVCVRVTVLFLAIIIQVFRLLFLLPIGLRRKPTYVYVQRDGKRTKARLEQKHGALHELVELVRVLKNTPAPTAITAPSSRSRQEVAVVELPRNQVDSIRALTDLGYGKQQAAKVVAQVVAEMGSDVPLNDMIRRALQLSERAR